MGEAFFVNFSPTQSPIAFTQLVITTHPSDAYTAHRSIITTVTSAVVEQSALHGILEEILNLNLPLITLIRIGSAEYQAHSVEGVEAHG